MEGKKQRGGEIVKGKGRRDRRKRSKRIDTLKKKTITVALQHRDY